MRNYYSVLLMQDSSTFDVFGESQHVQVFREIR